MCQITEIKFCPQSFSFRAFCLKSFLKDHRIFCQLNQYPGEGATPMHQRPISDGTSCVICSDAMINARFLPCGHDNFCLMCARRILKGGATQEYGPQEPRCPLCRDFAFVVEPYTRPPPTKQPNMLMHGGQNWPRPTGLGSGSGPTSTPWRGRISRDMI